MEYAYSLNNEDWKDYDSVIDDVNENNPPGVLAEIYKGEQIAHQHAEFININSFIETMQNAAWVEGQEFAEDYLDDISNEKSAELKELIVNWLNSNVLKPRFYTVSNITKETVIAE